jgi:pimeloyl-ACP methyl ester carboxylesterase
MNLTIESIPGLILKSHRFDLPLDYADPARTISVFARELIAPGKEDANQPYLVFFQGGPGFGSPRPFGAGGWIKRALADFRVLLLDQRGTGLSSPVTAQTMRHFGSPQGQAEYLQHFRADNIVSDAEAIRKALLGDKRWSILGQSFGGFCAMRYLSAAPEGLKEVLITGGVPSLTRPADDVYRATYPRVIAKNRRYYERYPDDVKRVRDIVDHLGANDVQMPGGGRLTVERFLQLGMSFGMSDGFEAVHYLIEDAFVDLPRSVGGRELNRNFLYGIEQAQHFDTNPIYTLLQEACYTQEVASDWSAERLLSEFPAFARDGDRKEAEPILFTGEMVYPWMLEQYPQLKPLKDAADLLAKKSDWPMLYDVEKLRHNRVPVAAAVYYDDMYVHREFSEETAQVVPNLKLWVTSEYEHNGLRADGEAIVDRLLKMVRGGL